MTYKINQSTHFISINGILADGDLANSEANIHLDTTSKDLKIKYKDDVGTIRTTLIGDSGTYAEGQVLFGDTDGSLTSDADLFWRNSDKTLGVGTNNPNVTAAFQVLSTTRGAAPAPFMTEAQRDAISSPVVALQVYNTDTKSLNVYDGAAWQSLGTDITTLVTSTSSGPWAAPISANYRIGFISDTQVAISIAEATSTATITSAILIDTTLPVAFRPTSDKTIIIKVSDNGANMIGQVLISSSGFITITSSVDNTQFTGSGTTGYKSFSVVYDTAL